MAPGPAAEPQTPMPGRRGGQGAEHLFAVIAQSRCAVRVARTKSSQGLADVPSDLRRGGTLDGCSCKTMIGKCVRLKISDLPPPHQARKTKRCDCCAYGLTGYRWRCCNWPRLSPVRHPWNKRKRVELNTPLKVKDIWTHHTSVRHGREIIRTAALTGTARAPSGPAPCASMRRGLRRRA